LGNCQGICFLYGLTQSQNKQKDHHDKKIKKSKPFEMGEKVLYFKVTLDHSHSGKFIPKWRVPFIIQQVLPNGAYKLQTEDGQALRIPINGDLLKPYYESSMGMISFFPL